jgi:hypothetical protein
MKKISLVTLLFLISITLLAQQKVAEKKIIIKKDSTNVISGSLFGDYSYVVQEPKIGNAANTTSGNNTFGVSRAQVSIAHKFNTDVSAKISYDVSTNTLQEGFVNWDYVSSMHTFSLGMMHSIAEASEEKIWNYRSLAPAILSRLGYVQEFDAGASLSGKFDGAGSAYYNASVENGNGTLTDNDKLKKISGLFGIVPAKSNAIEIYADYENLGNALSVINGKVMYGFAVPQGAFGIEGFYRLEQIPNSDDSTRAGVSIFSWFEMVKNLRGVLRIDGSDDSFGVSDVGYQMVYVNAGLDFTPAVGVHFIPNVVYEKKLNKDKSPEIADKITARLTASVSF